MVIRQTVDWDEFVRRANAYIDSGRLKTDEIDYKVEIGWKLSEAREAVLAGAEDWPDLVSRGIGTSIIYSVQRSRFRNWVDEYPGDARRALQAIWAEDDSSVSERIHAFSSLFPQSVTGTAGTGTRMNIISVLLMGLNVEHYPPFRITRFNNAYECTGYDHPDQDADEATLYEHALGFLDRFIEVASEYRLNLRHRLDAQSIIWKFIELPPLASVDTRPSRQSQTLTLHSLAQELTLPVEFLEEINTLLEDKKQVIFQGPPGTGKTFVARKLANHLAGPDGSVTLVQFHPSYSYEDFVQGFRPTILDNGQPGFKLTDGPLIRAAKNAEETDAKHFLIIDEINRGNLARILGEMYFLLEYRDEEISLQYQDDKEEKFSLPGNLYIIGTMNTADRSIALVDLALRRRFYFVEFHPDDEPIKSVLRRWLEVNAPRMARVADVVDLANQKLRDDRHAAIGPSYFMKPNLDGDAVERIWKHSVLPYIEERLFGNDDRISEFDLNTLRQEIGRGDTSTNGEQPEGQDGGE